MGTFVFYWKVFWDFKWRYMGRMWFTLDKIMMRLKLVKFWCFLSCGVENCISLSSLFFNILRKRMNWDLVTMYDFAFRKPLKLCGTIRSLSHFALKLSSKLESNEIPKLSLFINFWSDEKVKGAEAKCLKTFRGSARN